MNNLTPEKIRNLKIFSKEIQIQLVHMLASIGFGHIGGSLSICDLVAVLYGEQMVYDPANPKWDGRDRLVVSKGHSGPAVYSALALKGFFPVEALSTLNRPRTFLPSHCDRNLTPGIDMTTGSLGQGASAAAGIALALKMDGKKNRVYLILGDGECQEGQVWEMALFAAHNRLNNIIAFVDYNRMQIDGLIEDVCDLGNIADKFEAFNWHVQQVDGHNISSINLAIEKAKQEKERPNLIVLNTIKGKGWSKTENRIDSHHRKISMEEAAEAAAEMSRELEYIRSCPDEEVVL